MEVPTFDLSDKQAEAAYALASHAEHVQGGMQLDERPPVALGGVSLGAPPAGEEEGEEEDDEPSFGWEEPTVDTPKELLELWRRAEEGEHRIELKQPVEKFYWRSSRICVVCHRGRQTTTCVETTRREKTSS